MSSKRQARVAAALEREMRLFLLAGGVSAQQIAEELELHPTDIQFLNMLDLLGPLTPGLLAECSGLSSGGVTVVLDRLERAGYVCRLKNPADRRSVLVSLAPGRDRQGTASLVPARQLEQAVTRMTGEELETVLKFFTLVNQVSAMRARARAILT